MSSITEILEASWLMLFLISIIFIFLIINQELGQQTRKMKLWGRASYQKMLPRYSLISQHFNRKGELLTNTKDNICRSIRMDLLEYLQVSKGYSKKEIEELLQNKESLNQLFQNRQVTEFLYNPAIWLKSITPEVSGFTKFFSKFHVTIDEKDQANDYFYIALIDVIQNFKRLLDTG